MVRQSAIGGSSGEMGSAYRAAAAAWFVCQGLAEQNVPGLDLEGPCFPLVVTLETGHAVDDIHVGLASGVSLEIQAKRRVTFGSTFDDVVNQWSQAVREGIDPTTTRLILAAGSISGPVNDLAKALERRRRRVTTDVTGAESAAINRLEAALTDLDDEQKQILMSSATILELDVEEQSGAHAQAAIGLIAGTVVEPRAASTAWDHLTAHAWRLARRRYGELMEGVAERSEACRVSLGVESAESHRDANFEALGCHRSIP